MTSVITNLAGRRAKKAVEEHARRYEPEDPFYVHFTDNGGKQRRIKRPPPPGLTKKEARLLRKIQRRAHYLDKGFTMCGLRFGWTFFIGLIPGAGDVVDAVLNFTLVLKPAKDGADLPAWLVRKMYFNNAVSAGVGLVPIAGDIMLAAWKANSRNAKLLEEWFRIRGEENIAKGLPILTPHVDERGQRIDHPAQSAARDVARSSPEVTTTAEATATVGGVDTGAASTAASNVAEQESSQRRKKWF
ncbi:unnamed protein product [Parajaminaea phylloscopi]